MVFVSEFSVVDIIDLEILCLILNMNILNKDFTFGVLIFH